MSRASELFWPTLKDDPADAEAASHRLMVRAGLVRQVAAGLWTFLPAGWRAHRKVEAIIRSELDAIGAQEMLMPVLQPAELWKRTGRYEIDELLKLEDRKGTDYVLAMTHEENLTFHVANEIRSYRELPKLLYHFQTKERDEPRPRAGVLRTREFVMKDAYSFDRDVEGLERSYELFIGAYDRIFDRCGLHWHRVESDVGMMGGLGAHDYMAPCEAGENEIALAPGYAADVEVAVADPQPVELPEALAAPEEVEHPGPDHGGGGRGSARRRSGRAAEGAPGDRRGARHGRGAGARRPPPQRAEAAQACSGPAFGRPTRRRSPSSSARPDSSARSGPACR